MKRLILLWTGLCLCGTAWAGKANVIDARAELSGTNQWTLYVTVQHNDDGWDHYVDRWEILTLDGTLLDQRVLRHPHSPTPFTRSLPGAKIPPDIRQIRIRAHDSLHGYGTRDFILDLPQP